VDALHVGSGEVSASASHDGGAYTTGVCAPPGWSLTIGYTLPDGATPSGVTLDGVAASYTVEDTLRGNEVLVETMTDGCQTLVVTAEQPD
jgi:hypothetical protein